MSNLLLPIRRKLVSLIKYQFSPSHLIYITLICSIGITLVLGIYDVKQYHREKFVEFKEMTSRFHRIVNVYLESYSILSQSTRAIFSLSRTIDNNDWALFCRNIYQPSRYPGMIEMNYFKYLTRQNLSAYANFELKLNNKKLPLPHNIMNEYALLIYTFPIAEQSFKGYGDNLFNYYKFSECVNNLRDSSKILITPTYYHNKRSQFFIFTPVFYLESDFRVHDHAKKEFLGWISVSINTQGFFDNLLKISPDFSSMSIKVYEVLPHDKYLIYSSVNQTHNTFKNIQIIDNSGHKWEIQFSQSLNGYYIFNVYVPYTFFILIGTGLLITIITVLLIWSLISTKQRAIKLADQINYDFKRAEFKHSRLVQNISGVIFMCDPHVNWKMVYISEQFYGITGFQRDDFIDNKKRCFIDIVYPADIPQIEQHVGFKPVVGHKYFQEYRIIHADGSIKWIHERSQVVHDVMTGDNYLTGSFFDMTEQKRKEQEFRVLTNALKNAVGGIAFINKDLKHVTANYAYAHIFNLEPEQMIHTSLLTYIHHKDHYHLENALAKFNHNTDKIIINVEGFSKIKKSIYLNLVIVSAFQEAVPHRLLGYYCFVRDTSTDVLREHALAEAVKSAEAANKTKSTFLASMSHELRTPLNAIIGYSDIIQEEINDGHAQNETILSDVHKINNAGKHLLTLINDVLDVSKLEAGKMTVYLETFSIREVCMAINDMMIPLANKNDNKIVLDCPVDIGLIHSDITKVRQSLFNLMSNACKFTKGGTITMRIKSQLINNLEYVLFQVIDTGIGIKSEHIEKLFQPFIQADSSTTRDYGGTGLGLTITKRFCELLGGSCTVKSICNKGTTFTVLLPREAQIKSNLLN